MPSEVWGSERWNGIACSDMEPQLPCGKGISSWAILIRWTFVRDADGRQRWTSHESPSANFARRASTSSRSRSHMHASCYGKSSSAWGSLSTWTLRNASLVSCIIAVNETHTHYPFSRWNNFSFLNNTISKHFTSSYIFLHFLQLTFSYIFLHYPFFSCPHITLETLEVIQVDIICCYNFGGIGFYVASQRNKEKAIVKGRSVSPKGGKKMLKRNN